MLLIFSVAVILIIAKSGDSDLKILGVALISNVSGVMLGKIRTAKN
jgi:hypothetical protein